MHKKTFRRLLMIAAVVTLAGLLGGQASAAGTVIQHSAISWHAQQAALGKTGQVAAAEATLVRNGNGVSYRFNTNDLDAGSAYTLWFVVVNNPSACAAVPCTALDILLNPDTRSQVRYAAGSVAGGSGVAALAGHVNAGPLSGWLSDRSLEDPYGAEIHLVLNDHGPKIPELMPDMIMTYRGGCADTSPFPPIFPATALNDGTIGPNTCFLSQAAVFLTP